MVPKDENGIQAPGDTEIHQEILRLREIREIRNSGDSETAEIQVTRRLGDSGNTGDTEHR